MRPRISLMAAKASAPATVFSNALRSLETGGLTYGDVLVEMKLLLASGASPSEFRDILRTRDLIEPLPEHARVEMLGLLNEAIAREKDHAAAAAAESQSVQQEAASDQHPERVPTPASIPAPVLVAQSGRNPAMGPGPTAPPVRTLSTVPVGRGPQLVSTQLMPSRVEAAVARATALAADLATVRAALETERNKTREAAKALADKIAAMNTARARAEEALQDSELAHAEALTLRDSLAVRETELRALRQEHSHLTTALDARERAGVQLEAELQAARAREEALTADLAAVRTGLESEHSSAEESHKALVDRLASAEAARSRAEEEGLRLSERHQAEARTLRDALAERDAQIAALAQEKAAMQAVLDSRSKSGTQLEADLQAARARATAHAADLAATRTKLESEQRKAQENYEALTGRIKLAEAARLRSEEARLRAEEALREAENYKTESRKLRDTFAARDAELAALQQDHAKATAALDARSKRGAQLEADLQAARARVDAISSELKASQEAAGGLGAQVKRGESLLTAARTELEAVKSQSKTYLELLRTRDLGHDELQAKLEATEAFVEKMRADSTAAAQRAAEAQAASEKAAQLRAEQAERMAEWRAAEAIEGAQTVDVKSVHAQPITEPVVEREKPVPKALPAAARGVPWNTGATARLLGIGAVIIACIAAWLFAHHRSTPAMVKAPVISSTEPESGSPDKGSTVIRDCPNCPAMTIVPAGRFKQGSPRAGGDVSPMETPQHWVSFHRPFALSTNAVTVDEFSQFIAATGRDMQGCDTYDGAWKHQPDKSWQDPGFVQTGAHPVTCVSWGDADAYAKWLSAKTGYRYRLPSASEWEYAARAGGEAVQPWSTNGAGACASANVADQSAARRYPGWQSFACDDGFIHTSPVGSFKANSFGLNDMLGNVFQWTADCWHADYGGAPVDGSARTDGDCAVRELRGGSWFTTPEFVRASYRNHFGVNYRASSVGIRLVRDIAS
ncbi:MAG: hypothetical protein JWN43_1507 [Gammaproteobacteria bacterium]|nr:hypothetical protein [Gammaproteobacteria bacterium]